MPLLKKKVFEKVSPQEFLRDDEEVFYCELTNEIFRNYEEFAERMLLCTSMVWTCAMTGRSNLTYEEALESEENAKKTISEFPVELRIPVLYVATKTKRTGFGDMAEDVFLYCKDRYFIGEKLESCFTSNKWVESHVLQVVAPSEEEINKIKSQEGSPDSKSPVPPPSAYKYEIEHLDENDADISEIMIVDHNQLRRRKGNFSKEKCKLFLKQFVQQDSNSHWIIKPSAVNEFGIDKLKFDQIFNGPEPAFDSSKKYQKLENQSSSEKPVNGKKSRQETLSKYLTKMDSENKKVNGTAVIPSKESEERSAQFLLEMEKKKEEYNRMKQQKEEDQKWVASQLRVWYHLKEDLELPDQQALPEIPELKTEIPDQYIGDVLMVMEFIKRFTNALSPKKFIRAEVTLKLMERALLQEEVAGPLLDIVHMFLTALLEEQGDDYPCKATYLNLIDMEHMDYRDAIKFATLAAHWPRNTQGLNLKDLPMYSLMTVSEVLRLHLLSSGYKRHEAVERKPLYLRGGFTSSDDPGLDLRMKKPHILKALAVKNVAQLKLHDKIEILTCLVHQLLTLPSFRDSIDEKRARSREAKFKLSTLQRELKKCEDEYNLALRLLKKKSIKDPQVEKEMEDLTLDHRKKTIQIIGNLEKTRKCIHDEQTFIGKDRAYRKYAQLASIPALVVDTTEDNPGLCLPEKIKHIPELVNCDRSAISTYLEKNIRTLKNKRKTDEETPPVVNGTSETNGRLENGHAEKDEEAEDTEDGLLMCSANRRTCRVHSAMREQRKWKMVDNYEVVEELMATLNKRGLREGELVESIKSGRDKLFRYIKEKRDDEQVVYKLDKVYGQANLGFPSGTPLEEILQNTLTNEILELEEKMFTGALGQLRVKNREEWRNALSNKDYKNFDREIVRRDFLKEEEVAEKEEEEETEEALEVKKGFKDQDPGNFLGPVAHSDYDDEQSKDYREAVECLAIALAQVGHSIEPKFLQKPLGNSESKKLSSYVPRKTRLDKWEKSLLLSTSFSQVFLHCGTLESSMMWSRSTHHARCKHCNKRSDSENMLLCDNCNRGFHLYCLKPKLRRVPDGEWFCAQCEKVKEEAERRALSEVIPKKKQRVFKEEEEEEEAEEEEEDGVEDETQSGEEEDDGSDSMQVDLCATCNSGGVLITCEDCQTSYHKECVDGPVKRTRHKWICSNCKGVDEEEEEPKVQNNNDRNSSSRRSRRSEKENKKYKEKESEENSSDSSDNYPLVRVHRAVAIISNERRSAAKARHTISNFVKSLRRYSPSKDESDSGDSSKNTSKRKRSFRRECGRDDLPLHNAALQDLLQEVMKHQDAWPFLRPVKNHEVPDYHELISHPMDFGTIKYKLNMGEYQTDSQVLNDAALVFQNCNIYNEVNSEIHRCGQTTLKMFRNKCEELGFELPSKLADEEVTQTKRRKVC